MKESYLWTTFKQGMSNVFWSRVENVSGTGIPDVYGCDKGKNVWVELKMFRGKKISVRASQIAWHTNHVVAGGIAYFVCRRDDELLVYRAITIVRLAKNPLYSKIDAEKKTAVIEPPPEAILASFRKPFKWNEVRDLLFQ